VSLLGREPSHSADGVAPLTQRSASSTLKARPAKLHHAAANVDREDNHAPSSVPSTNLCLTSRQRLDNPNQITSWKAQLEGGAADVFGPGGSNGVTQPAVDVKSLHAKIGALTLENDFLEGALSKAGLLSAKR
jgi:hypothetical protein